MNTNFTMRTVASCSILVAACSSTYAGGFGGSGGSHPSSGSFGGSAIHSAPASQFKTYPSNSNSSNPKLVSSAKLITTKAQPGVQPGNSGIGTSVSQNTVKTLNLGGSSTPASGGTTVSQNAVKTLNLGGTSTPVSGGTTVVQNTVKTLNLGGSSTPVSGGTTVVQNTVKTLNLGGSSTPVSGGTTVVQNTVKTLNLGGSSIPASGSATPAGGSAPSASGTSSSTGNSAGPSGIGFYPALFNNWGYGGGYGGAVAVTNPVVVDQPTVNPVPTSTGAVSKLTLTLGQSYSIANDNFGVNAGEMSLQISGLTLPVQVDKWNAQEISFTLPVAGLAQPTDGVFQIAKADHNLSKAVPVTVIAAR